MLRMSRTREQLDAMWRVLSAEHDVIIALLGRLGGIMPRSDDATVRDFLAVLPEPERAPRMRAAQEQLGISFERTETIIDIGTRLRTFRAEAGIRKDTDAASKPA